MADELLEGFGVFGVEGGEHEAKGEARGGGEPGRVSRSAPERARTGNGLRESPQDGFECPRTYAEPLESLEAPQGLLGGLLGGLPEGVLPLNPVAQAELLALQVSAFPKQGSGTLYLEVLRKDGELCLFTNSRKRYEWAREKGVSAFVGGEYTLIAFASQNDRLWALDFRRFVARKKVTPGWRLTRFEAVGKVYGLSELSWTIGELLARLEARLVAVDMDGW